MVRTLSDRQRWTTCGILLGAWLVMAVSMAAAQEVDSRWAPWMGCWRAVDETAEAPLMCVVPLAGESAVEMLTIVDGQVVSRESIFADGQERPVSREQCAGSERAEFSDDSRRIYLRSELACRAGGSRTSTGLMSIVSPYLWLDVRTLQVDGQSVPWVILYRQATQADVEAAGQASLIQAQGPDAISARLAASMPIALDDVIEASGKVSAETLQIWVAERGNPFALDANRLIEMADAGVPSSVIDVVVAVSYPEKFVVEGGARFSEPRVAEAGSIGGGRRSALGCSMSLNPFDDPFYDSYGRYSYGSRGYSYGGYGCGGYGGYGGYGGVYSGYGGYGAFGSYGYGYGGYGQYPYGGYGYGGGYYGGYGGTVIIVDRSGRSSPDSGSIRGSTSRGRVVSGGGYTGGGSSRSTGRAARPRGDSGGGGGASARSSGGSSSAGRASAPSRSSGRSTGRTAQPRPGGRN